MNQKKAVSLFLDPIFEFHVVHSILKELNLEDEHREQTKLNLYLVEENV